NATSGTVAVNADNTVTFTPAAGFTGVVTFGYTVTDAQGDHATAMVTITVLAEGEVNHLPVANADSRGTEYQTLVTVDVLANDAGLEDAPVVVTISTASANGTAVVNADNTVIFTPAAGFTGVATFGYTVTDAQGDHATATVTITVLAEGEVNHLPVANDDRRGTSKSAAVTIAVLENDYGLEDQPVLVSISQAPHVAQGTVSVNEDNTIVFTPSGDYVGAATFNYMVTDANGDSDEASVVVNVKKDVNYLPDANDDEVETFVDTPINIVALTNDTGLNDAPVFLTVETAPSNTEGTIVVNDDNTILFTPVSGYMGSVVFFYRITDFDGDYSIARVTVNVVENLPTIVAVDDAVIMMMNTTVDVNVLMNDTGIEKSSCTIYIHNDVKNGYATMSSDGVLTYTPYIDFVGSDSLTYSICMGESNCAQAVVRITVEEPVPDALFIPEGFSPDGDGINDYFEIKGLKFFGRASVKIYNRWGNIVYSSDDYNNDWDGKSNVALSVGKTLPTGTYYYIIEVKGEKSKSYTGNVFLKR
ncbi:MAG: Ig-like domain-containing protein, partial [Tenuifilaceae bacterium]|nr:Ig-like domain-containing protein [Tenuifilaceae bacterium]